MGFLDTIREKLNLNQDEDYYEDDYDDYYEDDEPEEEPQRDTSGILGNTRRPEAESVSVYTRSGRPVSNNAGASSAGYGYPMGSDAYEPDYHGESGYRSDPYAAAAAGRGGMAAGDAGLTAVPRMSAAQLPPYVLKPVAYDDVQMVVRRVRTNQPVVLSFKNTNIEVAKRILDFCFGLSCGIGGNVEELGDRAFVVLPAGIELTQTDLSKLAADGIITR